MSDTEEIREAFDDAHECIRLARAALEKIARLGPDALGDDHETTLGVGLQEANLKLHLFAHRVTRLERDLGLRESDWDQSAADDQRYHDAKEDGRVP